MRLSFTKMHAAGNDYIYVDGIERRLPYVDWPRLAVALSRRRFAVGADGIILILPSERADFRMHLFNADGSVGDMCGNGVRCVGAFAWNRGFIGVDRFGVETREGIVTVEVRPEAGELHVGADMTPPRFLRSQIPMTGDPAKEALEVRLQLLDRSVPISALRVGNPHCVIFVRDVDGIDLDSLGPMIENHEAFPERTNVEFAEVESPDRIRARVWERGSGITFSCGTGACAVAVAAMRAGRCNREVLVRMPGGNLDVRWDGEEGLFLGGRVHEVYRGSVELTAEYLLEDGNSSSGGS